MTTLHPLTATDTALAARIHATAMADGLGGHAWDQAAFQTLLTQEGTVGWRADEAGVVLARAIAGEAEILTLGVTPAARRQGIARALLATCYAVLPALGAVRLTLEVAVDNLPAQALYRADGFSAIGRRPGYYRRGAARIDALVMARAL